MKKVYFEPEFEYLRFTFGSIMNAGDDRGNEFIDSDPETGGGGTDEGEWG